MNVQELIKHLQDKSHKNIFVVGPYIGRYELLTEKEAEVFTQTSLDQDYIHFYELLNHKILTSCNELNTLLTTFKPFVKTFYAQTVNGFLDDKLDVRYIKGNAKTFKCTHCHKHLSYEQVIRNQRHICSCGHIVRPDCLLTNESYDLELIETYERDLDKADTIFLIGFDFNEIELCKQLEVIAAKKGSGDKGPVVVVVGECDKKAVYETFYPEFIVDEKPETALKRLIELF